MNYILFYKHLFAKLFKNFGAIFFYKGDSYKNFLKANKKNVLNELVFKLK